MELYVYSSRMVLQGLIEKVTSLIWTRRYWSCGEFKLLVPFTEDHARLLVKYNIVMKRGDTEAAEIQYVNISKNSQGLEEIEVQGRFIISWIGKRIIRNQVITTTDTQSILYRIVNENVISTTDAARKIPNVALYDDADTEAGIIEYVSEPFTNALHACETAAKSAKLGFRMITDVMGRHYFSVYKGRNLTVDQNDNPPCVFSEEFDNIVEQEYTNSVENLKSTAYVGGEEKEGVVRKVAEVGDRAAGLNRNEVYIDAADIMQEYENDEGETVTLTDAQYLSLLAFRGTSELEQYAETLAFSSKVNTHANLKYREDYDLGDRVTCINKKWGIKINVRITEITETYQQNVADIEITFGESLPELLTQIRQITR